MCTETLSRGANVGNVGLSLASAISCPFNFFSNIASSDFMQTSFFESNVPFKWSWENRKY